MGAGDLEKLTGQFLKTRQEGEVFIVVCGNNKKMFQKMKKKYKEQECIVLVGQTRQMEVYMKACDMVYTKPGGLPSTELLCPRFLWYTQRPYLDVNLQTGDFLSAMACPLRHEL